MKTRKGRIIIAILCLMFVAMFQIMTEDVYATCDGSGNCNVPLGYNFTIDNKQAIKMNESYSGVQCGGLCLRDIFIGENSGALNPNADNRAYGNVFVGRNSGSYLEIGAANTFIGDKVAENLKYGIHNTYIGSGAGKGATFNPQDPTEYSPSYSVAIGSQAGYENLGSSNVFVGAESGRHVSTGSGNIMIGLNAGAGHYRLEGTNPIETGSHNIHIGYQTESKAIDLNNTLAFGYYSVVTDHSQMVYGSNVFYWEGYAKVCSIDGKSCDVDSDCTGSQTCIVSNKLSTDYVATCNIPNSTTEICVASDYASYRESYWGSGVTADWDKNGITNAPKSFRFNATGGEGDNRRGADLILAGGKSTGSALGGKIVFQTSPAGASNPTDQNVLEDRMIIDSNGNVGIGTDVLDKKFHVLGTKGQFSSDGDALNLQRSTDTSAKAGYSFEIYKSRGSVGYETNVFADDTIGQYDFYYHYNGGPVLGARWGAKMDDSTSNTMIWFEKASRVEFRMDVDVEGDLKVDNGYVQLALISNSPPVTDCNESTELGRMKVDSTAEILYICMDSGWIAK